MKANLETVQPVLMSRDVSASMGFFEKLGFTLEGQDVADYPKYARMCRDNVEIHFSGMTRKSGTIQMIARHTGSWYKVSKSYTANSRKAACPT
jgi:hypothetical protein